VSAPRGIEEQFEIGRAAVEFIVIQRQYLHLAHLVEWHRRRDLHLFNEAAGHLMTEVEHALQSPLDEPSGQPPT
jgi:hypothetical protein